MLLIGIVAEFNPLHTGHAYLLRRLREQAGQTGALVCAMSGNYVQRGDFAIAEKYTRAHMAVASGADLVVELPLPFALSSAEGFAAGAIDLLAALGCTHIGFGAETADLGLLSRAADGLSQLSHTTASSALCYAAQRQQALAAYDPEAARLLDTPNNTLAICYLRAMRPHGLIPLVIARRGTPHDAPTPKQDFACASALRTLMQQRHFETCARFIPPAALPIWTRAIEQGYAPVFAPDALLLGLLRRAHHEGRLHPPTPDGFDRRLCTAVLHAVSYADAIERARTRRFPAARVRRALLRAALGLPPLPSPPLYARVLALGTRGRAILRQQRTTLPILVRATDERKQSPDLQIALSYDIWADELFGLAAPQPAHRDGGLRWTRGAIFVR